MDVLKFQKKIDEIVRQPLKVTEVIVVLVILTGGAVLSDYSNIEIWAERLPRILGKVINALQVLIPGLAIVLSLYFMRNRRLRKYSEESKIDK